MMVLIKVIGDLHIFCFLVGVHKNSSDSPKQPKFTDVLSKSSGVEKEVLLSA